MKQHTGAAWVLRACGVSLLGWFFVLGPAALATTTVLVSDRAAMTYLANSEDPGVGQSWTAPAFDDGAWEAGIYGVGYDTRAGAQSLLTTVVPSTTLSIYTRTVFVVPDVTAIQQLFLGCDFDDGVVAWINGVEVFRSTSMPAGDPAWNTAAEEHESSNASLPRFEYADVSATGIEVLENGENVLAIGVWNSGEISSDLVLVPTLFSAEGPTLTRGPYLQSGTEDSIVVRWRTDFPTASVVQYGLASDSLTSLEQDLAKTVDHEITLPGLVPDTTYYYAIGDASEVLAGGDADHFFVTAPPAGSSRPTRIWVLGDSGKGTAEGIAVRDAYYEYSTGRHTDLWLMLGDNAYPDGTDADYQAKLFDVYPAMLRQSSLWPTLGNHDAISADALTQSGVYFDLFTLPTQAEAGGLVSGTEAYYSFDFGNIHFVVLESNVTDRSTSGAMLDWLDLDLASNDRDWVIAFWHHPPYSKGSHDSDTELRLIEMRENAVPILEAHGVDLVLSGHSHSYERSFFIDGVYETPTPGFADLQDSGRILDEGDGRLIGSGAYRKEDHGPQARRGAVYAVAGSSSSLVDSGVLDHPVMFRSLLALGSLILDVDVDRLDARFLDDRGQIQDHFTLSRQGCLHQPPLDGDGDESCDGVDNCPGLANPLQADTDGDGHGDVCDACPEDSDPLQTDTDGDGSGDACDACPGDADNDSDGDGVCGDVDNCPVNNPDQEDADADGRGDSCDPCPFDPDDDIDADTVCGDADNCPALANAGQVDADGDGLGDVCDACRFDTDNDVDGDGVCGDADNCPAYPNPAQLDADGDGPGDACDACPLDPQNDADGDTICSGSDNCPATVNPNQGDADLDGAGDACDPCPLDHDDDLDGDGICGEVDNCPAAVNPGQADGDGDGIGDACDLPGDGDGDGVVDPLDNCVAVANPTQLDTDLDGQGNACDLDDDGDTVPDTDDCASLSPGVSEPPGSVGSTLRLGRAGGGTLRWNRGLQGHTSTVFRGFVGPGEPFAYNLACIESETPARESVDSEVPLSGGLFYYVVSARNACGDSGPGTDSSGATRPLAIACPVLGQDVDGDGALDVADNCSLIANPAGSDYDHDFVGDSCDNCVTVVNPAQADSDQDGRGDACVGLADADDDGFDDDLDNCPSGFNLDQSDQDADGQGDVCDACPLDADNDQDFDGACADVDNCPSLANAAQEDADSDGLGNACDPAAPLTGQVFEDVNYGGGAGRDGTTPGAVARPGVRAELYGANGDFMASTLTDASGRYAFEVPPGNSFTVRIVNVSVSTSRAHGGLLGLQTYRTDASDGTLTAVTDRVGGEEPSKSDAGNGATTLADLVTATTTPQSVTQVWIGAAGLHGVDFGFNFNTVVNANDAGQGSLRQFLLNAGAMPDAGLAQQDRPAGIDNAIFMLADGTVRPGLNAGYPSLFVGGIATISPAAAFPAIDQPVVIDATLQPGYSGTPLIELDGGGAGGAGPETSGLLITAGASTVRGLVINGFGNSAIYLQSGAGNTVAANYLGTDASGSVARQNFFEGVAIDGSSDNTIGGPSEMDRNIISGNRSRGVLLFNGASNNTIQGNYIGTDAAGTVAVPNDIGVYVFHAPDNRIGVPGAGNLISGNTIFGVYLIGAGSTGNLVQGNGIGVDSALEPLLGSRRGVEISSAVGNTIGGPGEGAANIIAGHDALGIRIFAGAENTIASNSIFANGGPGIHLGSGSGITPNDGVIGSGPNSGMDYPVLNMAFSDGTSLHVEGYVGTMAQPVAGFHTIELFKADDTPSDQNGEIESGDGLSVPHGEGRWPIGTCMTQVDGTFSCDITVPAGLTLPTGAPVTATATDALGNTSEFGANLVLPTP